MPVIIVVAIRTAKPQLDIHILSWLLMKIREDSDFSSKINQKLHKNYTSIIFVYRRLTLDVSFWLPDSTQFQISSHSEKGYSGNHFTADLTIFLTSLFVISRIARGNESECVEVSDLKEQGTIFENVLISWATNSKWTIFTNQQTLRCAGHLDRLLHNTPSRLDILRIGWILGCIQFIFQSGPEYF